MSQSRPLVFQPTELLLPTGDLHRWSVIACDQFTSDGAYWAEVERIVGDVPSSLRLMLPEYYLGRCDEAAAAERIRDTMISYLEQGVFRTYPDSLVYLERRLSGGTVRRGVVGMVDLEAFDYAPDSASPIRASEHTVEDRLPPRVKVRREAALEMPHTMLFLNDPQNSAMRMAEDAAGETLYDFDLMCGGGHIRARRITGDAAWTLAEQISGGDGIRFAVGDGNHSLAAARNLWLENKTLLTAQQTTDPARYALVELVNIHDPAVTFEPIHRVLFQTDPDAWFDAAISRLYDSAGREITLLAGDQWRPLRVKGRSIGELIDQTEHFCRWYCGQYGGVIDYIHGGEEAISISGGRGCCGVLLPQMEKSELFPSVESTGPFPKKSFSIGLASDKRYYLECRKIK